MKGSTSETEMEKENRDADQEQLYTCQTGTDESNVTGVVGLVGNRWSSRKHRLYKSRILADWLA